MATHTITVGIGTLVLGPAETSTSFSGQVTACKVTPAVDTGDAINVLDGGQVAGDRSESFTLDGTMLQDIGAAGSLSEWTWTHRGEDIVFEFFPNTAAAKGVTGTVTVEATDIGGDVKTKPTADFSWVVVGTPTIIDADDSIYA